MALIQHWKLQDNAADAVVAAAVGSAGTLTGGDTTATLSQADGPGVGYPRSLLFDGAADAVDISAAALSFASGAAFSFACWFKAAALGVSRALIGLSSASTDRVTISGSVVVNLDTGTTFTFVLNTGTWYHVLVSRTAGNSVRAFVNGVESATGAVSKAETFAPNRLAQGSSSFFQGNIADARVYNSDESANVAAIMADASAAPSSGVVGGRVGGGAYILG